MQAKYDLISISVLTFLFYGLSWLMVQSGLMNKLYHRRFWNALLLISFLVSGGFGLFLTFQINYDWDISIADDLTFWHVDVGVALFWIALFHILWHLNYFSKIFKSTKDHSQALSKEKLPAGMQKSLKIAAISLGATSFITQVVFIREFLALFSGNELIIGVFFFNWLVLTGFGSYIGKNTGKMYFPVKSLKFILILLAVLPVLTLFLMIYLKNRIFLPGTETGLTQIVFYSFFLLIPFNLFSGFLFSLLSFLYSKTTSSSKKAHLIYAYEAIGSLAGGLLFNFLLIYVLDSFRTLLILLPLNVFTATLFFSGKAKKIRTNLLAAFVFISLFYFPLEKIVKEFLLINQKIVYLKNSPYGNVILTENSGQINFYENGNFLFSTDTLGGGNGNIAENEESVHFAMLQSKNPQNILLVSGGISGQLNELLKYPVKRIDYLEINPALISGAEKFIRLPESDKINYRITDVRLFLQKDSLKYDVILLNIPPPLTAETNRYYTLEFFKLLQKHLNPQGIVKTQLPSSANYLSKDAAVNHSVLYATLSKIFKHVAIIPGEKDYFLASSQSVDLNFAQKILEKNIENEYIAYYLDDFSIAQGAAIIKKRIDKNSKINRYFSPVAYMGQIKSQMSRFKSNYWILAAFLALFFIFLIKNIDKTGLGMFAIGFASMSAELLIILSFQIIYGNIFSMLSMIIMLFMAGLAAGAMLLPKYLHKVIEKQYRSSYLLFAGLMFVLPFLFVYGLSSIKAIWLNYLLIFLLTLIISALSGYIFYLNEQLSKEQTAKTAGKIYSADLFGSATGALTVSMLILPLAGFSAVGIIAGIFCIVAILSVLRSK